MKAEQKKINGNRGFVPMRYHRSALGTFTSFRQSQIALALKTEEGDVELKLRTGDKH